MLHMKPFSSRFTTFVAAAFEARNFARIATPGHGARAFFSRLYILLSDKRPYRFLVAFSFLLLDASKAAIGRRATALFGAFIY